MKQRRKLRTTIHISIIMWVLFAASFLLMKPVVEIGSSAGRALVMALGLCFWCTLLLGIVFQMKAAVHYRSICAKEGIRSGGLPGFFCFFSNPPATVADLCLLVSVILGLLLLRFPTQMQYIYFAEFCLLALAVSMHCIFNGKMVRLMRDERKMGG